MKHLRYLIEYLLARIIFFLFDTLPYGLTCLIGRVVGYTWWLFDRDRQKVAQENVLRSGIETDPKKALAIGRKAAQHMAIVTVESLRSTDFLNDEKRQQHISLKIAPDVLEVLNDPNQALIVASGHFGNWEVAAHLLSQYKPVAGITRKMNNPLVEKLVKKRKSRYRFRPIPKHDSNTGRFLEVLDNHEILALLFDQHAGDFGMMVDFFGHPAATFKTAAMLHLVTRTPLCVGFCKRTGPLQFEISTSNLIHHKRSGKKNDDIRAILEELTHHLETAIRSAPEQYMWGHRRWRD